ncbi:MAG: hypothetical protein DRJ96_03245 [Thermoprotei archaeon]|nr:MAG: hypothetical protein DRJ96_03245 [Thermoprotei archaeon]
MLGRENRCNTAEDLGEVESMLNLAYASLVAASRLMHDRRMRRKMLLEAALSRTALITPDLIGALYIKSCLSIMRKVSKKLEQAAEKADPALKSKLRELATALSRGRSDVGELMELVIKAREEVRHVKELLATSSPASYSEASEA